jgi:trehalose 6-phosphate phosphatase
MIADAFAVIDELREARSRTGRFLLGLDFDGTLAPIVEQPDDATLPAATRPVLAALADRPDTSVALISGRGIEDLHARVALDRVFYAGNHGLEIDGPGVHRVHGDAAAALDRLASLLARLRTELGGTAGVIVEDKGLTASVHYRLVETEEDAARVRDVVHARCRDAAGLRANDGKKVVEIRPEVAWDKGRALGFLRDALADGRPLPTAFIGDDRTDEDAFREIGDEGWSIIVGRTRDYTTVARAVLDDTADVAEFLRRLL